MAQKGENGMVTALYALIIGPIVLYIVFTLIEIWTAFTLGYRRRPTRVLMFIQASTELTNTILVFAYAQFMVTFSALLVTIGAELYVPVALLMASLLLRGAIYLFLFYVATPPRWLYASLIACYIAGVIALIWGLYIVIPAIIARNFVPYTNDIELLLAFGAPALAIFLVPLVIVYRNAIKELS